MSIRKVIFSNATPKAIDHGALFAGILADGVIKGCDITYSANGFTVPVGYLIASGRLIEISGEEILSGGSETVRRVYLRIDATDQSNEAVTFQTDGASAVGSLPSLQQDDINSTSGGIYELELAVYDTTSSTLTKIGSCARPIYVQTTEPTSSSKDGIYIVVS